MAGNHGYRRRAPPVASVYRSEPPKSMAMTVQPRSLHRLHQPRQPRHQIRCRQELPPATHRWKIQAVQQVDDDERYKDPRRPLPASSIFTDSSDDSCGGSFLPNFDCCLLHQRLRQQSPSPTSVHDEKIRHLQIW
ncbi:hypothetical protein ACLOJK_036956 [Asimina triloba]